MGILKLGKPIGVSAGKKKTHEYGNSVRSHYGIDYPDDVGNPILASERGIVIRAADNSTGGYGNVIIINHTPKAEKNEQHIYTLYAHLDKFATSYDDKVVKGQKIGECGETGNADGPHLHFEVISSPNRMGWGKTGATGFHKSVNRVNPVCFFGHPHKIKGTTDDLTDEEADRLIDEKISFEPEYRFGKKFRLAVLVDGVVKDYIDKDNLNVDVVLELDDEELKKLMASPAPPPKKSAPLNIDFNIKL